MTDNTINNWLNKLFPRYSVQWWRCVGDSGCGGGTGAVTLKEAQREMVRAVNQGATATLYRARVKGCRVTMVFPAIEERGPLHG